MIPDFFRGLPAQFLAVLYYWRLFGSGQFRWDLFRTHAA